MLLPPDPDVQADRARYGPRPALREQSWWAVRVYRFGRQVDQLGAGPVRRLLGRLHWALSQIVETLTGITLPKEAVFGPGLRIHHFGGVVVHRDTVAGARTTLRQGVTLGERTSGGGVPVLGDDVDVGAHAQVLGPVRIGDGARLGALALVIKDVPPGGIALAGAAVVREARSGPSAT